MSGRWVGITASAITDRIAPYASFVDPGATNVRTPSWEATGQLIAFIRNPAEFPIRRRGQFYRTGDIRR